MCAAVLTQRLVAFCGDHGRLSLPVSKADPWRQGVTLLITQADSDASLQIPLPPFFGCLLTLNI